MFLWSHFLLGLPWPLSCSSRWFFRRRPCFMAPKHCHFQWRTTVWILFTNLLTDSICHIGRGFLCLSHSSIVSFLPFCFFFQGFFLQLHLLDHSIFFVITRCRLGQIEDAKQHLFSTGGQPDAGELQKLQTLERHLGKCDEARKVGDWKSALREAEAAIAEGADSSPTVHSKTQKLWIHSRETIEHGSHVYLKIFR